MFDLWPEWRSKFIDGLKAHVEQDGWENPLPRNVSKALKYLGADGTEIMNLIENATSIAAKRRKEATQDNAESIALEASTSKMSQPPVSKNQDDMEPALSNVVKHLFLKKPDYNKARLEDMSKLFQQQKIA